MHSRFVTHKKIYLLGLAGFLFGLAMSEFVISVSQFLLAANWLISRNFSLKWERIKSNPTVWIIWFFYLLHAIGMAYTSDVGYGLDEMRIKLPFLLLPLFIVSEKPLSKIEIKGLLSIFVLAVVTSASFGIVHYFQHRFEVGYDVRQSSLFVPHIRLSLMSIMAIVWLFSLSISKPEKPWIKITGLSLALFLVYFIWQLQSLTGLIILPIALFSAFIFSKTSSESLRKIRIIVGGLVGLFLAVIISYGYQIAKPFIEFNGNKIENLERNTANGNMYLHRTDNLMIENGNQVWIYISDPETRPEWNKRSEFDFDGEGKTGELIRPTLYRYLTSRGVRKDSIGMQSLTPEDVFSIENGEPNIRYVNQSTIEKRVYQTMWELNNYQFDAGSHEGHSVAQRIEFWQTGLQAFLLSPLFGNGTGDVRRAMGEQYAKNNTALSKARQLKPHNQYITTGVALGVTGLLALILCFVFAFPQARKEPLQMAFMVILLMSFISEDTIDAQVGASIFAGFYALFFCQPKITTSFSA